MYEVVDLLATYRSAPGMQHAFENAPMPKAPKYETGQLIAMFRLAAKFRNSLKGMGFPDNGGAIHSAERILNLLGLRLCYPDLNHINKLRDLPNAPFSAEARIAHAAGERVFIEHVSPHRALTALAIEKLDAGMSDEQFATFVKDHFRLALLTAPETARLNKKNRSKIEPDRLQAAGILLHSPEFAGDG
jgi:hypothetical protein